MAKITNLFAGTTEIDGINNSFFFPSISATIITDDNKYQGVTIELCHTLPKNKESALAEANVFLKSP